MLAYHRGLNIMNIGICFSADNLCISSVGMP